MAFNKFKFKIIHPLSSFWIEADGLDSALKKATLFATLLGGKVTLIDTFGEELIIRPNNETVVMPHD